MYNGIGLRSARGSATNGHIQTNLAAPRPPRSERSGGGNRERALPDRKPDSKLLAHEERRQVEVRCMELRIQLENEEELPDEEIDARVAALREDLQSTTGPRVHNAAEAKPLRSSDVHRLVAAKDREMQRFASALGMRDDYRPGEAFEDDYADRQRIRRQEEKEARKRERHERQLARGEAQKRRQIEYEERMAQRAEASARRAHEHFARDRPELAKSALDAELDAMAAERQRASPSAPDSPLRSHSPAAARDRSYDSRSPSPRGPGGSQSSRSRSRSASYDSRESRSPRRSASPRRRSYTQSQSRSPSASPRQDERRRRY